MENYSNSGTKPKCDVKKAPSKQDKTGRTSNFFSLSLVSFVSKSKAAATTSGLIPRAAAGVFIKKKKKMNKIRRHQTKLRPLGTAFRRHTAGGTAFRCTFRG